MLHTIIEKNSYHDSIVLMLLTNHLKEIAGVNNVQVMMGDPRQQRHLQDRWLGHAGIRPSHP